MKSAPDHVAVAQRPAGGEARSESGAALANMVWLLGDKALALVIGLLIFGTIGRTYGPEGSGHFAYAAALLQTGLSLSMVCAGVVLLPRLCRMLERNSAALAGALANVFVLRIAASLLAMSVLMVFTAATVQESDRRNVTLIMLMAIPLIEPFYIFATYWQSRNQNKPTVIARSSGLLLRTAVVLTGLHLGAPMWVLATAWLLEATLNAGLQFKLTRPALPQLDWRRQVRPARMSLYLSFGLRFVAALWLSQLFLRLDRLLLAQWLSPHDFGIYAAPMQLVEVWTQVSYLIASSIATAYLYKNLEASKRTRAFLLTASAMASIGLLGLVGAWLLGPWLLNLVFGSAFAQGSGYLIAGAGVAILLFADQSVDMLLLAKHKAGLLTLKWAVALLVAGCTLLLGYAHWGAYAGPLAMGAGILTAWLALLLVPHNSGEDGPEGVTGAASNPRALGTAALTAD